MISLSVAINYDAFEKASDNVKHGFIFMPHVAQMIKWSLVYF